MFCLSHWLLFSYYLKLEWLETWTLITGSFYKYDPVMLEKRLLVSAFNSPTEHKHPQDNPLESTYQKATLCTGIKEYIKANTALQPPLFLYRKKIFSSNINGMGFYQRLHSLTSSDQTPHKLNSDYSAALTQLDTPNHPRLKILLSSLSPGPFYQT